MNSDDIDADMQDAVEQRFTARLAAAKAKRDRRREQLAELSERRRHGLASRHAAKLARTTDDDDRQVGEADDR